MVNRGVSGKRVLLPRAAGSRKVLIELLSAAGANVHEIQIYQARLPEAGSDTLREIFRKPVDFITFTSSSTVHNFMEMAREILPRIDFTRTHAACIGPITAATLREYGIEPAVEAKDFTIPGLVHALIEAVHSAK